MKNKLFLYSLTSLAVTAASLAHADEGAYVPTLEGGITGSVGTFLVTPTSDFGQYGFLYANQDFEYENVQYVNPGYQLGIDASLGYIFEETANSVELYFRNINTSDSGSASGYPNPNEDILHDYYGDIGYGLNAFDLMFSQFVNLGEVMQLRLSGGVGYLQLKTNETAEVFEFGVVDHSYQANSKFRGWGPRVAIDTRYGFDDEIEGLGIVGGGSMAYFQGDLDSQTTSCDFEMTNCHNNQNNPGNHAVLNFRANLGIDYVYFFDNDEGSTLGLELGYLIDFYDDGAATTDINAAEDLYAAGPAAIQTTSVSFAGPYLTLKGVF